MENESLKKELLKSLPGVDHIFTQIQKNMISNNIPRTVIIDSIRTCIEKIRLSILKNHNTLSSKDLDDSTIIYKVNTLIAKTLALNLKKTINATGVILHTNLGRSVLPEEVLKNITAVSSGYSNLELNLSTGKRGLRYSCVDDILCKLSGAEAAMVVNNNAAAVLLCLETIAKDKQVIVSRGEMVEIGGSFRIPDVMVKSGCILKEIGTTNRTHVKDYENAITDNTGLLLKVHTSNYSIVGFSSSVSLNELHSMGLKHKIPVMEDLGSGTFIDFSKYGLTKEPTISESIAAGADIVTFSGDKLLGGPQAGIIIGKKKIIDKIKENPLTRALRIDKITLSALEATLNLYRDEKKAIRSIPTLKMLLSPFSEIEKKAEMLNNLISNIKSTKLSATLLAKNSKAGGGSMPLLKLQSKCIGLKSDTLSTRKIEKFMRANNPPVIGRIEDNLFIIDLRTVKEKEIPIIAKAVKQITERI